MVVKTNKEYDYNRFVRKLQEDIKRLLTPDEIASTRQYFLAAVDSTKDTGERTNMHIRYVKENLLDVERKPRQMFTDYRPPNEIQDGDFDIDFQTGR
jgi:hypothetical protein